VHSFTREFPRDRRYDAGDMKEVLQRAQTEVGVMAEFLREVDVDLDVLRIMMKASNTSMAFLTNDEAIGIGAQVYDEKTKTMIDPAPVLERLAKARLEARIAAAAAPIKLDEPTRVTTTRRSGPVPAAGSSDAPSLTQPVVHREPAVRPTTADRRRPGAGNADSGSR
jgi:hypothetical protein